MAELKKLKLLRIAEDEATTFGVIIIDEGFFKPICLSIENKWKNNEPWVSCIPDGEYICEQGTFSKAIYPANPTGITYQILDIPGRSDCIFHPGNTHFDTSGCILPVTNYSRFGMTEGGGSSRIAHTKFINSLNVEVTPHFNLTIRSCDGRERTIGN